MDEGLTDKAMREKFDQEAGPESIRNLEKFLSEN